MALKSKIALRKRMSVMTSDMNVRMTRVKKANCSGSVVRIRCFTSYQL